MGHGGHKNFTVKKVSRVCADGGLLLGEYDQNRKALRECLWLEGRLVGFYDGTTNRVYRVYTDHLGTPRALSTADTANQVVWRWVSEDWRSMASPCASRNQAPLCLSSSVRAVREPARRRLCAGGDLHDCPEPQNNNFY